MATRLASIEAAKQIIAAKQTAKATGTTLTTKQAVAQIIPIKTTTAAAVAIPATIDFSKVDASGTQKALDVFKAVDKQIATNIFGDNPLETGTKIRDVLTGTILGGITATELGFAGLEAALGGSTAAGAAAGGSGIAASGLGAGTGAAAGAAATTIGAGTTAAIVGGTTTAAVLGSQAIQTGGQIGLGAMALDALKNPYVVAAIAGLAALIFLRKK
jgi:hypothetical protein